MDSNSGPINLGIICMGLSPFIALLPFIHNASLPLAVSGAGLFVGGCIQQNRKVKRPRNTDVEN